MTRPIVWSIAGHDSGGGAGLSADQRAAEALGVHLCPVVAAITAQNSQRVSRVQPVDLGLLDAQLDALAEDLPPTVIKTGLLGSAAVVERVAAWVDRLRAQAPVALVVDPVLGASSGAPFADDATLTAYRQHLLPRATVITPNQAEARRLLLAQGADAPGDVPAQARALRALGCQAVVITGGDAAGTGAQATPTADQASDWLDTPNAQGWLTLPRVHSRHTHGTGCTYATSVASALALGFVAADAAVLAKMATTHAIWRGQAAGAGPGPVLADGGFALDPNVLPLLGWGEADGIPPWPREASGAELPSLGLYALASEAQQVQALLDAGLRTLQLRIKRPADAGAPWQAFLRDEMAQSVAACAAVDAELFINDHWQQAIELGAPGVHLGQEDLLDMGPQQRAHLVGSGLKLGISSHSLWELCRARTLRPRYVACGPVWPTLTKAMPWRPQGLDNLGWWRHMAGCPVVAIGGILDPQRVTQAASTGADGVCVVRAVESADPERVRTLQMALTTGRLGDRAPLPALPHPSL